jgi:putative transposase
VVQPPQFRKKGEDEAFGIPTPNSSTSIKAKTVSFSPNSDGSVIGTAAKWKETRNITVSIQGGKYFVSIQTRREVATPAHRSTSAVAIDMGVARFATLSDGSYLEPLKSSRSIRTV